MKNAWIRKIILIAILFVIINTGYGFYEESKIKFVENYGDVAQINEISGTVQAIGENSEILGEKTENTITISDDVHSDIEEIPDNYLGFDVSALLTIPSIELEVNVLKNYTKNAMDVCATKFWGPEPNEVGNFCIVGHNYEKKNMFNNLIDLEIGDELFLQDNKNGKVKYRVFDIYKVNPNNTVPLEQDTDGKKIITLITCVNYSNKRLIVQAVES